MLSTVCSANDRGHASSWPCQREGVCKTVRGITDFLAGKSCQTAADFVGTRKGNGGRSGNDETVEVDSDLKGRLFNGLMPSLLGF